MDEFVRVSRAHPCPVCGKPDWCTLSADGRVAFCMRVPSARQASNGGYVHVLRSDLPRRFPRRFAGAPSPQGAGFRPSMQTFADRDRSEALDMVMLDPALCEVFGARFADEAWRVAQDFGAYWSRSQRCMAVPMRGPDGQARGIRYREVRTGRKWAQTGGGDGLFMSRPEAIKTEDGGLWIAEGMTDSMTLAMLGFPSVGRSSCNCGSDLLAQLCAALCVSCVTIVADSDGNRNAMAHVVQPGLDGARALAKRLGLRYRFVFPPRRTKDVRGYLLANADYGLAVIAGRFRQWAREAQWQQELPRRKPPLGTFGASLAQTGARRPASA